MKNFLQTFNHKNWDPDFALHGGQGLEMFTKPPIPSETSPSIHLNCQTFIKAIQDKISHLYIEFITKMFHENILICQESRGIIIRSSSTTIESEIIPMKKLQDKRFLKVFHFFQ